MVNNSSMDSGNAFFINSLKTIGNLSIVFGEENAIKLIEYLTSEEAQEVYVSNSYEYPANPSVEPSEIVKNWGEFKIDKLNLNALGEYRSDAIKIFDRTGWK